MEPVCSKKFSNGYSLGQSMLYFLSPLNVKQEIDFQRDDFVSCQIQKKSYTMELAAGTSEGTASGSGK